MIPFLDLKTLNAPYEKELIQASTEVIQSGWYIHGKACQNFEQEFSDFCGTEHCIGVANGLDALTLIFSAYKELGILTDNDEVIVPANTYIASILAISKNDLKPVLVEPDIYTYNLDPSAIEVKITSKTKAIMAVHLYGQVANMSQINEVAKKHDLKVIEDSAQAHAAIYEGKRSGNLADASGFSFYPGKNLGAYGEAGALITNDKSLYLKAKMIRQHGEIERYNHKVIGHNYRMEAIQRAVLSTKLKYLEEWTQKRKKIAQLYTEILSEVDEIQTPKELDGTNCVYHLYVIQTENRGGLQDYLQQNGISTGLHYPIPLHLQEAYRDLKCQPGDFSVAEKSAGRILSLPMYPELNEKQIRYVCDKIKEYIHHRGTGNKIF